MFKYLKNNYHISIYILIYFTLLISFIFNIDISGGPSKDLEYTLKQVYLFEINFLDSFLNYHQIEFPNRLSPIYISLLTFSKMLIGDLGVIRFIFINIIFFSQLYFYKSLKILFYDLEYNKKILFTLSSVILISPNFQSNTIWIESSMFGLIFFLIGNYYFLKNFKKFNVKNVYLNIIFIAVAAYFRPSYCLFAIFYFYKYFNNFKNEISFVKIIFVNIILAFPAIYYVFIKGVFFINFGGLSSNYFDKIAIISSIIFFHSIPFMLVKKQKLNLNFLIISIFCSILIFF